MGVSRGEITTRIVKDGLIYNLDPGNRASTQPITAVPDLFNTINLSESGSLYQGTYQPTNKGVIDLDGVDDYIELSTPVLTFGNTSFTISMWWYLDSLSLTGSPAGQYLRLIDNNVSLGSTEMAFIITNAGASFAYIGGEVAKTSNSTFSTGNWFNIVLTREQTSPNHIFKTYKNASQVSSQSVTKNLSSNNTTLIGKAIRSGFTNAGMINGQLGPVHVYNRALSANEVLYNYNGMKARFGL
jgi:hypothetical protein